MVEEYVYIFVYMYMVQVQGTECTVYWELATGQRVKDLFVERNRLFATKPNHITNCSFCQNNCAWWDFSKKV